MRIPHNPVEVAYLRALLGHWRGRAREQGSITLEWIVIIAVLFLAAVWAATKIDGVIRSRASQIK